jgi:glycosyltransferase involved in cell wall biosynthesis
MMFTHAFGRRMSSVDDFRSGGALSKTSKIVVLQPAIQHYRIPVFDHLKQVLEPSYDLHIYGSLDQGEAFGGGKREYFHPLHLSQRTVLGARFESWSGVPQLLMSLRPSLVVAPVYVRNLTSWSLPSLCSSMSIPLVGWTKVSSGKSGFATRLVKRAVFGKWEYMLVYGQSSKEELLAMGFNEARVFVTNNTIDTDKIFNQRETFRNSAQDLRKKHGLVGKKILLCVAKMEPQKRHADLLDAWKSIREIDDTIHLVLIGGGRLQAEINHAATKLDSERIHFLGRVPAGEDFNWIAAADATIQCGAVGLAIIQSMAFGVTTIIADEAGPDTEPLVHGQTGLRYEKGNIAALVETVKCGLFDCDQIENLSHNSQQKINSEYSVAKMVTTICACFNTVLSSA